MVISDSNGATESLKPAGTVQQSETEIHLVLAYGEHSLVNFSFHFGYTL